MSSNKTTIQYDYTDPASEVELIQENGGCVIEVREDGKFIGYVFMDEIAKLAKEK